MTLTVIYVQNNIAGARRGQVLNVEWSDHWAKHEAAGNIVVVREDPAPLAPPAGDPVDVVDAADRRDDIDDEWEGE